MTTGLNILRNLISYHILNDCKKQQHVRLNKQIFIPQFFPNYLELLDHIGIIKTELENKKLQQKQFIQWQKDGKLLKLILKLLNKVIVYKYLQHRYWQETVQGSIQGIQDKENGRFIYVYH